MTKKQEILKDKVNTGDSYPLYKTQSDNPIEKKIYLKILNGFFKYLIQQVMDGYSVKLPLAMGVLYIRGMKVRPRIAADGSIEGLSPNWRQTKELWDRCPECKEQKKVIYNLNEHTNGLKYNFQWSKKDIIVEQKSFYSLRITRTIRREASELFKSGKEYIVEQKYKSHDR